MNNMGSKKNVPGEESLYSAKCVTVLALIRPTEISPITKLWILGLSPNSAEELFGQLKLRTPGRKYLVARKIGFIPAISETTMNYDCTGISSKPEIQRNRNNKIKTE